MEGTAIVSGASSGIGLAVCEMLLEKGYRVYGLSRRGTGPEGAVCLSCDVTDEAAARRAAAFVFEKEGRIDILVNNAGMGISGPVEFTEEEDARRIMDVNFMGQFFLAKAVLPYMREQKSGHIVCVSSVAAPIAIPYQGFYSASKAAVNGMALAMRNEVKDFGIKVSCVMPGDAATGFTDARKKQSAGDNIYTHNASAVEAMEKDERGGMTPAQVAGVIVKAALKASPAPLYTAGGSYKLLALLFRLLPARLAYFIVGKLYS
ncbi:MAG: SDR family oxidoreductase [Firmicutes bacterium]|nr:SDR family oxidoreductase [Bacillota bacterium]